MRQILYKLLKTKVVKMSELGLSTMLMKTQWVRLTLHDVDEKKSG